MLTRRGRLTAMLLTVVASSPIWFSGCDSKRAGATADPQVSSDARLKAAVAQPAEPLPKLKPGAKTVALDRAGDRPYDKSFDDLRFEMIVGTPFKRSMLTKEIESLAKQRLRIRGFMLPPPQQRGIKEFVLVRDNQVCCFGPGAALYDCILVKMATGKTAEFSIKPMTVEGVFDIQEFVLDGKHLAIYHLDAESAQ